MAADDGEDFRNNPRMQPRRFIDVDMIDTRIGTDIDVGERAVEARPAPHISVVPLRQIENARDVVACSERLRAVERHDQRYGNALAPQIGGHFHDCVSAERMTDQDDRPLFAGLEIDGRAIGERLPLAVAVHRCVDTTPVQLLRQCVHAEREYVHQPAQQINMRSRFRGARFGSEREHRNDQHANRGQVPRTSHKPLT